jgi:glycolate oxidase iron-sulfur subunit
MDTPRGRLLLMDALDAGAEPSADMVRHLDLCLGCRACETECPSGVRYGARLQHTREQLHGRAPRPLRHRLLERAALAAAALPPRAQDAGAWLLREMHRFGLLRMPRRGSGGPLGPGVLLGSGVAELDGAPPRLARRTPSRDPNSNRRVALLLGCVQRTLCGSVHVDAARLLAARNLDVLIPRGQRCCGALHAHAGDRKGAQRLARRNIVAFERAFPLEAIAVDAAGCGAALREYGELLADDPAWAERGARIAALTRDVLELLADDPPPFVRPVPLRVAYHDACHLAHVQGVRSAPRTLLARVPGLQLVPLEQSDRCCGAAGLYGVLQPDESALMLRDKLERVAASGAQVVTAANPGCLLQLAAGAHLRGLDVQVRHPLSLLAQSLA